MASSVLLLLPMVLGAAWSWSQSRRARTEEVRQDAIAVAAASAAAFDQFLRGLDSMASALALNPSVIALNRAECDRLFAEVLRDQPFILNILLNAPDETIEGSGTADDQRETPAADAAYPAGHGDAGGRWSASCRSVPLTHKPTVILGYPVRSNLGTVVGVLALGLDLSQIQSTFARIAAG